MEDLLAFLDVEHVAEKFAERSPPQWTGSDIILNEFHLSPDELEAYLTDAQCLGTPEPASQTKSTFTCKLCSKNFGRKSHLTCHQKRHFEENRK